MSVVIAAAYLVRLVSSSSAGPMGVYQWTLNVGRLTRSVGKHMPSRSSGFNAIRRISSRWASYYVSSRSLYENSMLPPGVSVLCPGPDALKALAARANSNEGRFIAQSLNLISNRCCFVSMSFRSTVSVCLAAAEWLTTTASNHGR